MTTICLSLAEDGMLAAQVFGKGPVLSKVEGPALQVCCPSFVAFQVTRLPLVGALRSTVPV